MYIFTKGSPSSSYAYDLHLSTSGKDGDVAAVESVKVWELNLCSEMEKSLSDAQSFGPPPVPSSSKSVRVSKAFFFFFLKFQSEKHCRVWHLENLQPAPTVYLIRKHSLDWIKDRRIQGTTQNMNGASCGSQHCVCFYFKPITLFIKMFAENNNNLTTEKC